MRPKLLKLSGSTTFKTADRLYRIHGQKPALELVLQTLTVFVEHFHNLLQELPFNFCKNFHLMKISHETVVELHFSEIAECHKTMILMLTNCATNMKFRAIFALHYVNHICYINILFLQRKFHISSCFWKILGIQLTNLINHISNLVVDI